MDIRKVGVVGCGLMGSGIAQVAAMAGCETVVHEISRQLLDRGLAAIDRSLSKFVEKGQITSEQRRKRLHTLSRPWISPTWRIATS
jgi:3-hydroxybutyryl-CoA dehydrogenase